MDGKTAIIFSSLTNRANTFPQQGFCGQKNHLSLTGELGKKWSLFADDAARLFHPKRVSYQGRFFSLCFVYIRLPLFQVASATSHGLIILCSRRKWCRIFWVSVLPKFTEECTSNSMSSTESSSSSRRLEWNKNMEHELLKGNMQSWNHKEGIKCLTCQSLIMCLEKVRSQRIKPFTGNQ